MPPRRPLPSEAWDTYPELAKMAKVGVTPAEVEAGKVLAELEKWRHLDYDEDTIYDVMMEDE